MELSEKLQELRKEKGLTQEELAEALFVSRTAISKWESGRGVPNIESLKAISKFFSVSIDELLSGEEILKIADEDNKQKEKHTREVLFLMEKIKEFYTQNKKIIIPVAIILVLLIAVGIYFISQPNDNANKKAENQTEEKVDISRDDKTEDEKDSSEQSTDKSANNGNGGNASSNGGDGGSSNHGGNSSASKPSTPSHTHSWKDHTATKQVWVSNIVPVYEDQQVQVGTNKVSLGSYWHCNCGAEVPSSSAKPHIKAHLQAGEPSNGYNQEHFREEPVYETKRVQVGTRDDGHYETQTYVDYKYCDCGAKK